MKTQYHRHRKSHSRRGARPAERSDVPFRFRRPTQRGQYTSTTGAVSQYENRQQLLLLFTHYCNLRFCFAYFITLRLFCSDGDRAGPRRIVPRPSVRLAAITALLLRVNFSAPTAPASPTPVGAGSVRGILVRGGEFI